MTSPPLCPITGAPCRPPCGRALTTYEFSIIASGLDPWAEDFATRFYDAGCNDATVSFQNGRIIVDFAREAGCMEMAIVSAIECVRKAGATVERIENQ